MDNKTKRAVAAYITSLIVPYYEGAKPWSYAMDDTFVEGERVWPCPHGNGSQCAIQSALRLDMNMHGNMDLVMRDPDAWLNNAVVAKYIGREDWKAVMFMHDRAVCFMDARGVSEQLREAQSLRIEATYLDHTWGTAFTPMLETWLAAKPGWHINSI